MAAPNIEVEEILFRHSIDKNLSSEFGFMPECIHFGGFKEINWLNTPGPIYTTCTDNCGTGQIEAPSNVGGDEDYREIIFKQPFSKQELKETLSAAACDLFGSYYFDGNQNWNLEKIISWWDRSEDRINYIIERYKAELGLPDKPHITHWKIGEKIVTGRLYGPPRPIPENYKYWLDFYQFEMKDYLEWYIFKLHGQKIILPTLDFDWARKQEFDELFNTRK